ncbi:glucose-1-phosphate adenylyltransferase, GlgD subunit [Caldicellulosiruptor acetigenus I77R1B]|uniref:Glucose-1-phosphate adenylyltransferase, GlgD subunit n=1 Tax=Caldicellulosiruptor acetigenus (strain ATCC 700853 / DSM 12137 / I77R1B) TaxID=632335 RepID=E4S578_CALA7|nr:glucose-1-phosphate adenylyltransferase subunit GlgD [Caldicellulosiruptor acetigenus]ADQ41512.1 glucose-1-phosphate adenylyltransferase, GlgD subunit [Caldicellulosiruptor acetigenus I77R1B]
MLTNYLGIVSLTENESKLKSLTATRPLASIPIFGRYRVIDFTLSNLVNAGVTNVGILAPTKSRSLIDHVGTGKPWDLNRKVDGLYIFNYSYEPPSISDIKLLKSNMEFLLRSRKEMTIFTSSHMICNIDFEDVAKFHEESGADVTVVYKKIANENDLFLELPTLMIDQNSNVMGVGKNIGRHTTVNISLDMFVLSKEFLIDCILTCLENGNCTTFRDFIYKNVQNINLKAYEFKGYVGCINSISSYFKVSMDMLNVDIQRELFSEERPIYTKSNDSPPTRYFSTCEVENSFISNGCLIAGKVKNSIISRGVVIEKDAIVENSIIFSKCIIKSGAILKNVILDKNVVIDENATLIGHNKNPLVMEKQSFVNLSQLKEVKRV